MISRVRLRNSAALIFISGLVIVFSFYQDTPPQSFLKAPTETKKQSRYPINIIESSTVSQFDEQGKLLYTFKSSEAQFFQKNPKRPSKTDYTDLTEPNMTLYSDGEPPWRISAKNGIAFVKQDQIKLTNNVLAWQYSAEKGLSELKTSKLVIMPKSQRATTDKAVELSSTGHHVTAPGLIAELKKDKIKLLSNVRGTHEPL